MIWLLTALGIVRKALTAAFGFARRYPLQAVIIALLLACGWLWHGKAGEAKRADRAEAQVKLCNNARSIERKSIKTLTLALDDQSARNRKLSADSVALQKVTAANVKRERERGKASEATAQRIERAAPVAGCRTGAEIMDSREQL